MKTRTLTKAEKQNWKPLRNVVAVKISAKKIKGERVVVASNSESKRLVIA